MGYFRNGDIFIIYNHLITDINLDFNQIHSQLQFSLESETNNTRNHLDISVRRIQDKLEFAIYCKPTFTNTTILYTLLFMSTT